MVEWLGGESSSSFPSDPRRPPTRLYVPSISGSCRLKASNHGDHRYGDRHPEAYRFRVHYAIGRETLQISTARWIAFENPENSASLENCNSLPNYGRRKALRRLGTCRQVERRTINSTETQSLSGYKSSPVTNTCASLWWRMRGSISRRREGGGEGVEEGGTPVDVTTASRDTNRRWEYCPSPPPPTISRSTSKWVRFAIKCSVRNAVQCTVQLCMLHGTFM